MSLPETSIVIIIFLLILLALFMLKLFNLKYYMRRWFLELHENEDEIVVDIYGVSSIID